MEQVNALSAFREGYGLVDDLRASRAQRMAGQALSAGDYGGAANALYREGQIGPGAQVQQMGQAQDAAQANALAGQQKQQQADFKDAGDFLLKGTQALLQNYSTPEQAFAQYQQNIRPVLLQIQNPEMMKLVQQIDAQGVNGFSKEGLQQFATMFGQEQQKAQGVNLGGGAYGVFDPNNQSLDVIRQPDAPKSQVVEGPDGLYERQTDGSWKQVAKFGAAPKTFAPQRASGGAGGAKLPPGFILDGN